MGMQVEVENIFINDRGKNCRHLIVMFAAAEVEMLCYENENTVQKAVDEQ